MFLWLCCLLCAWSSGGCLTLGLGKLGQPHKVPVNSSKVLTEARYALVRFNLDNIEELFAYKIIEITSAKMQIVAGVNYFLEMLLGRTVCKRLVRPEGEPCALNPDPKEYQCLFVVTDIPWKKTCILSKKDCHVK